MGCRSVTAQWPNLDQVQHTNTASPNMITFRRPGSTSHFRTSENEVEIAPVAGNQAENSPVKSD